MVINEPTQDSASYLQPGMYFKQKGQRNWRLCKQVISLANAVTPEPGKLLIIYDGCRQLKLDQTDILIYK